MSQRPVGVCCVSPSDSGLRHPLSFLPLTDEASISLAGGRIGLSGSLVGATVGDEEMVFLNLRLLRGALSLLQELLDQVLGETCVACWCRKLIV